MSLNVEELVQHYREQVRSFIEGRPWLVAADVLVAAGHMGQMLMDLGADRVLAIGSSRGVGDLPPPEQVHCIELGLKSDADMMQAIRQSSRALANLPDWALAEVDRFDPDREALVFENAFSQGEPLAGRPVFGPRHPDWQALEDKMIIDALWDDAGIERAPSAILPADFEALWSAHERLDSGMGTVWVGDNREGWHGGAKLLRWVRSSTEGQAAHDYLSSQCDKVRVMPFLEGIPCSIHGWVFPDAVIGFRPCEMLVFRIPGSDRLSYAGAATAWVPSAPVQEAMENAVVRVGEHIRERVGYRGSFTLDGVATSEGFFPTELNPRFGGALNRMSGSMPDLPLYFLHVATMAGKPLDYRPVQFQELVRSQAAANPVVRGLHMIEGLRGIEEQKQTVCRMEGGWREADSEEKADAVIRVGPAAAGTVVLVSVAKHAIRIGSSAALDVCRLIAFADHLWALGIGPLEPAPDLREDST